MKPAQPDQPGCGGRKELNILILSVLLQAGEALTITQIQASMAERGFPNVHHRTILRAIPIIEVHFAQHALLTRSVVRVGPTKTLAEAYRLALITPQPTAQAA